MFDDIAKRSWTPTDRPLWLKSGVTSGGRKVFIVRCSIPRGKHDREPAERMTRRQHTVDPAKRIETRQRDLGLVGEALHRIVDVTELDVLREKHAISFERSADREARFESPHAAESLAEPWHEVARFDRPVVRAAPGANLHQTRRKPPVLRGERVGEQLDRLQALSWQFQIELT